MAGFLDKKERVLDVILTQEGRRLLAEGELEFVYYAFFDDEVDYRPSISPTVVMFITITNDVIAEVDESYAIYSGKIASAGTYSIKSLLAEVAANLTANSLSLGVEMVYACALSTDNFVTISASGGQHPATPQFEIHWLLDATIRNALGFAANLTGFATSYTAPTRAVVDSPAPAQVMSASIISQIDETIVVEASPGMLTAQHVYGRDTSNVNRPLYTVPTDSSELVHIAMTPAILSGSITVDQAAHQRVFVTRDSNGVIVNKQGPFTLGFERYNPSELRLTFDDGADSQDGYLLTVFKSGSDGYSEKSIRIDSAGEDSYGLDLRVIVDDKGQK